MKRFASVTAAALLITTVAGCRRGPTQWTQAGDLKVDFAIDPNPPTVGENHLRVELHDASGKPVDGARLGFVYDMPAMGAMPEMKGGGEVRALGGGRYDVTYPLSMLGDWYLTLAIEAQGHPPSEVRLKISPPHKGFTVERRGPAAGAGAGSSSSPPSASSSSASPMRPSTSGRSRSPFEQRGGSRWTSARCST